jgi:uncharacterized membrane protein YqjE
MPGLVREFARSLLSFAETRARIAANELEEQLARVFEIWAWAVAAAVLLVLGVLMASACIVLALWDTHRVLAAGLLTALYLAAGIAAALIARARIKQRPKFLAATLEELARDREQMEKKP